MLIALQTVDRHKKGFVLVFDLKVELRKLFKLKPDEHLEIIAQCAEEDKVLNILIGNKIFLIGAI